MAAAALVQETLCTLRRQIAVIEGRPAESLERDNVVLRHHGIPDALSSGSPRFDAALGGGLPQSGLIEVHGCETRDCGAVTGFALAVAALAANGLPLLWIGMADIFREAGRPYAPGLAGRFGIAAERLLTAQARKIEDLLWIAEEAMRIDMLSAVILELRGNPHLLDLKATRRLHRRSLAARTPLILLRQAGRAEATAAPLRLLVKPARASSRRAILGDIEGATGPPGFYLSVDKSPSFQPLSLTLEWQRDMRAFKERIHAPLTRNLRSKNSGALAPSPADRQDPPPAPRKILAFPSAEAEPAAGDQPARKEHAAHRRAGREG